MERSAYILAPHVALRSWKRVPYAYIERFCARPRVLSAAEFEVALACDGKTAPQPSDELDCLLDRGLVLPCEPGAAKLTAWQRHRSYSNRVMPWLALEVTARCNYNCIHCFNAIDNGRLHAQMSLEQVESLLDEAHAMGVSAILLTGGEPLLHPQFLAIVSAIYEHDMFVFEINTNGRLLDVELLEEIASFGFKPEMKISFDGLGYHDWMRGCPGAEGDALRAIELCVDMGFPVRVQMNVNRKNRESIMPSLELLDRMGVGRARIIPTTLSVRWEMNAQGQCLSWSEYLEAALDIAAAYAAREYSMELNFWRVATLRPRACAFSLDAVRYSESSFKLSRPCCRQINGMSSVAADGEIYPCLQCSGWYAAHDASFGNAFDVGLATALRGESYCRFAHATVADKLDHQRVESEHAAERSCAECPWVTWCAGGCPALSALTHEGDMLMPDPCSCEFFEGRWAQRFTDVLPHWRCLK